MKTIRIIPRLDVKGPNLVKGVHLEGLRVLGKPEDFAFKYYSEGADELVYMDVVASLYNRNSLHDIIERTAQEAFIPLTVGGGLRSIEDMRSVLRSGADKVALNTAIIKKPQLIREAVEVFGASTIVVSIEAIKQPNGRYFAYTDNGREYTGIDILEWAYKCEQLGAGEILLTSVDREGTGEGFDVDLIKIVSESVGIPVIACGGAGSLQDIEEVIVEGKADAVCIASLLHYGYLQKTFLKDYHQKEGNVEYLRSGGKVSKLKPVSMPEIKNYLLSKGINCRATTAKMGEKMHA